MKPLKPFRLRQWRAGQAFGSVRFFTCARPGRTGNEASKSADVADEVVHRWVLGLPGPHPAIVSLLGCKPGGPSEFSFYSFYGGFDSPSRTCGAALIRRVAGSMASGLVDSPSRTPDLGLQARTA